MSAIQADARTIFDAIDQVLYLCQASSQDAAIEHAVHELEAIRDIIHLHWPLSADMKRRIDLGPFAAKNIEDWNPVLADALMSLDHALQNDGLGIESVFYSTRSAFNAAQHAARVGKPEGAPAVHRPSSRRA